MSHITFKQYRNIDLSIFAVLLVVSEAITAVATKNWFSAQPIAISTTLLFTCICMMRWSGFAAIHACLGGLVFCLASGGDPQQYLIYGLGNLLTMLSLLWFKAFKKEKIREDALKLVLFVLSSYLLMQTGRWLISMIFGGHPRLILVFLGTDVISLLFTIIVIFILRKTEGMIEDQKAFLFRQQREREDEIAEQYNGYGTED